MDAQGPRVVVVHRPDLRSRSTQKDTDGCCIVSGFQVLIDISRLKRIKLAEQAHSQAEAAVFKLRLLGFMIHDPVPRVLHLIDIRAIPVLVECERDLHGGGDAVVEFRPLQDVLARVVLEFHLHVGLGHRGEPSLVDLWDPQSLRGQRLHGTELQSTPAH